MKIDLKYKYYYFNSQEYGMSFHTLAKSKKDAIKYVSNYINGLDEYLQDIYLRDLEFFINNPNYIEEHGVGSVVEIKAWNY